MTGIFFSGELASSALYLRAAGWCIAITFLAVGVVASQAQNHSTQGLAPTLASESCNAQLRPDYHPPFIRWTEDWSFLKCKSLRADRWDRLKYIPLGHNPQMYLSLGGEARGVYEAYQNQYWGSGIQDDNGWFLQNYLLHADLHFTEHLRLFTELQSSLESGRAGGPRPYDRDTLDLHQAFFDLPLANDSHPVTLRVGRQELQYGSGRLVDARFGLNTRISFDGFKLIAEVGKTHIEGFATRPTFQRPGIFDDTPNSQTMFWGVYGTRTMSDKVVADGYYFGYETKSWTFASGTGQLVSHTLGTRVAGTTGRIDFNDEANIQFGSFGDRGVRAWSVSLVHGYSFTDAGLRPHFAFRSDVTSGDRGKSSKPLGSFFPLFASGKYFEEADLNGPVNTIDVIPSLDLHPAKSLTIAPMYGAFWRESTSDGLYGYVANLYRPGNLGQARFIGQLAELDVNYLIAPHTIIRAAYEHFQSGSFLHQTPPGKNVNYGTVWIVYHF